MTEETLAKATLLAFIEMANKFSMFAQIMFNNIIVSLLDYVAALRLTFYFL